MCVTNFYIAACAIWFDSHGLEHNFKVQLLHYLKIALFTVCLLAPEAISTGMRFCFYSQSVQFSISLEQQLHSAERKYANGRVHSIALLSRRVQSIKLLIQDNKNNNPDFSAYIHRASLDTIKCIDLDYLTQTASIFKYISSTSPDKT